MNQRDLLAAIQKKTDLSLKDVKSVVEAFFDTVTKTSKKEPVRTHARHFRGREARRPHGPQSADRRGDQNRRVQEVPFPALQGRPRKP